MKQVAKERENKIKRHSSTPRLTRNEKLLAPGHQRTIPRSFFHAQAAERQS